MNRELEKLVQQYADLYPYQPTQAPLENILSTPTNAPPDTSIDITTQRPPVLNPAAKDLQLLPIPAGVRTLDAQKVSQQIKSRNQMAAIFCGENLYRLVLVSIIVICLIMYFRKK